MAKFTLKLQLDKRQVFICGTCRSRRMLDLHEVHWPGRSIGTDGHHTFAPKLKLLAVPDVIAGTWDSSNGFQYLPDGDVRLSNPSACCQHLAGDQPVIILLVESPHKDEFKDWRSLDHDDPKSSYPTPIGPLQNTQVRKALGEQLGDQIRAAMSAVEQGPGRCLGIREAKVIFANPVQFQTSLISFFRQNAQYGYSMPGAMRDSVWKAIFDDKRVKQSFLGRLMRYHPRLILSAPTGGNRRNGIRDKLNSFFINSQGNLPDCHVVNLSSHPSCWRMTPPRPPTENNVII